MNNREMGVWHFNLDEEILTISKGIERIRGYSSKDFINGLYLWRKVIHPRDLKKIKGAYKNLLSGRIIKHQYRIITKDKQEKWVKETIIPTINRNGVFTFFEGLLTEIPFPHAIKPIKSESNNNKIGRATFDLNGKFKSFNKAVQEISGYSEKELLSMTYLDLIPVEEKERVRYLFNDIINGGNTKSFDKCLI